MIKGLNHITLTVTDVEKSLWFYHQILGFQPEVRWSSGAYLSTDGVWLCLSVGQAKPAQDYTHIAFSVSDIDYANLEFRVDKLGLARWQKNSSEGNSIYLLDPDGHKLELHSGTLGSRLEFLKRAPYEGLVWLNK